MNEEQLNKLFQEVREIPPKTSPDDVSVWVSDAAQSVGSGLSTQSFFTFKGIAMITTLVSIIGIAVYSHFAPAEAPPVSKPETPASATETPQPLMLSPASKPVPKPQPQTEKSTEEPSAPTPYPTDRIAEVPILPVEPGIATKKIPTMALPILPLQAENPEKEQLFRENFTRLKISSAMKVWITQGDMCDVRVETEDGTNQDAIKIEQFGETLELSVRWKKFRISDLGTINVYVTVQELKGLEVSGAVEIHSKNKLNCTRLDLELSGAVSTDLEISAGEAKVESSGAVDVTLRGDCRHLDIETSGATEVIAPELVADTCVIETSGASKIDVRAVKELKIEASGASEVTYRGEPEILEIRSSGASEVKKVKQSYKF